MAAPRRRARVRDHGGLLPPPHGAHARRDDARAGARRARRAPPRARPRARPAGPRRRRGLCLARAGVCDTIGAVRFPVVLFDLDGTLIDSGRIILASMRHAATTVLGRDYSDEVLMAAVGGPGLEHQMRALDADARRRARHRLPRAQRGAPRRRCCRARGWWTCSPQLKRRGPDARDRHRQAPRDRRARLRRASRSGICSTSSSAATTPSARSPIPSRSCSRSNGSARRRRGRGLRRRLAVRHRARRRRPASSRVAVDLGRHPRARAARGASSPTRSSTRGGAPCRPLA